MGLLEIIGELNIEYYLALKNMMLFMIELDTFSDQKTVLHMFFLINMGKSNLIQMRICL